MWNFEKNFFKKICVFELTVSSYFPIYVRIPDRGSIHMLFPFRILVTYQGVAPFFDCVRARNADDAMLRAKEIFTQAIKIVILP